MRLPILAAAVSAAVLAAQTPAAAQALGQSCVLSENSADPAATEPVRRYLAQRPGHAVTTCSGDRGVSYQAMSPVRVEAGVCRMSVRRYTVAGLAAAGGEDGGPGAFEFMAEPDAGECPARGKGRWIAVTDVAPPEFARISRFAAEIARGGRAARDGACRKREDKLRRLAQGHALISVLRDGEGAYVIRLLRSGMGYAVRIELTPEGACVRDYGQFIL